MSADAEQLGLRLVGHAGTGHVWTVVSAALRPGRGAGALTLSLMILDLLSDSYSKSKIISGAAVGSPF